MKLQVRRALDKRNYSAGSAGANVHHSTKTGKVQRAVGQAGESVAVESRGDESNGPPESLGEIGLERGALFGGQSVGDESDFDRFVGGFQRSGQKQAKHGCDQSLKPKKNSSTF
jgi:hypothetical protein